MIANTITLVTPSDDMTEEAKASADTLDTFTIIPPLIVERLGVVTERVIRIRLANGTIVKLLEGTVKTQLNGTESLILHLLDWTGLRLRLLLVHIRWKASHSKLIRWGYDLSH